MATSAASLILFERRYIDNLKFREPVKEARHGALHYCDPVAVHHRSRVRLLF